MRPLQPLAVVLLLAAACNGGNVVTPDHGPVGQVTGQERASPANPESPVVAELRLDQTVTLEELRILWLSVNDSRCPIGVRCVWEGEAIASLEVSRGERPPEQITLKVRAGIESQAVVAIGHEWRLLSVEPFPRDGVTTPRADYLATVEIRAP